MKETTRLQNKFLLEVSKHVGKYGFSNKIKEQSFEKKTDFGKVCIHFSFGRPTNSFDITIDVGIRFDDLENLINETVSYLSEKAKKETYSMGCELGNLSQGKPKYWVIGKDEDIIPVALEIISFFERIGLPYLEKYSNMRNAKEALSSDGPSAWLYSAFDSYRAKNAVGLTFLLDNMDEVLALAKVKEQYLKERNDFGLSSFQSFVKFLIEKDKQDKQQG